MKVSNIPLIAVPVDMSNDFDLGAIYVGNIVNFAVQVSFTGTPVGLLKLRCSNDPGKFSAPGKVYQTSDINNWTDIVESYQAVMEDGNHTWNVENCGYMWVSVSYVATSGPGLLTEARIVVKGV